MSTACSLRHIRAEALDTSRSVVASLGEKVPCTCSLCETGQLHAATPQARRPHLPLGALRSRPTLKLPNGNLSEHSANALGRGSLLGGSWPPPWARLLPWSRRSAPLLAPQEGLGSGFREFYVLSVHTLGRGGSLLGEAGHDHGLGCSQAVGGDVREGPRSTAPRPPCPCRPGWRSRRCSCPATASARRSSRAQRLLRESQGGKQSIDDDASGKSIV